MSPVCGFFVAALGAALSSAAPSAQAVVERVVAVVRPPGAAESRVVTLTRVEDEMRIALVSAGATLAATRPLDAPALRAGLDWLIDQMLLNEEAERLQVFEIERPEVLAELNRFRARFERAGDYRAFLARYDLSEEEVASVLQRTLRVRRYVESRVSRPGRVSEADVTSWIASHRAGLPSDPAAARAAARARLLDERFRQDVKVLVRDLCARAEVRLVHDFGAASTDPASTRDPEG